MFIFFTLSLGLLAATFLAPNKQTLAFILSFIVLFILFAFRGIEVGTDTINYAYYFDSYYDSEWMRSAMEPGWVLVNDIASYFGWGYRGVMVISSLLCLLPIYYAASKHSKNAMLVILLYFLFYYYLRSFNITRQFVAVGFGLLSIISFLNRRNIFFLLYLFIAFLFHKSALVLLFLYSIRFIPSQFIIYALLIAATFVVGLFGPTVLYKIISLTPYAKYLLNYEYGNFLGNAAAGLLLNSYYLIALYYGKNLEKENKVFLLFVLIFNVTIRLPFAERLLLYFSIYQIIYFTYVLNDIKNVENRMFFYIMIIVAAYFVFFRSFGAGGIFPYSNILI